MSLHHPPEFSRPEGIKHHLLEVVTSLVTCPLFSAVPSLVTFPILQSRSSSTRPKLRYLPWNPCLRGGSGVVN